jgi:choline dehydrogenase-like flavoprotein
MTAAAQTAVLDAVCDTFLPALESDEQGPVGEFMRRGASDYGIPSLVAAAVAGLRPGARGAIDELLARLTAEGFAELGLDERVGRLLAHADRVPEGRFAVKQLKTYVFGILLNLLDEDGRNPIWDAVGFPGPIVEPPSPEQAPKTLPLVHVNGPEATLEADVCIVGSGAGGSVIAARLAAAGKSVLILEMGTYKNEADFRQLDSSGATMFLGGGLIWSEFGDLGVLAGSTLGGGTVINSLVSLRTPTAIRERWAQAGLEGLDTEEFDRFTDLVWERLNVNTEATHYNENTRRMIVGLTAHGYAHERLPRNASLDDDPALCGYCNNGCLRGCKRSTLKTYLQDAADAGAQLLTRCRVERITVEDGRATGVEALVDDTVRLTVRAGTVVVAAGGVESPALLLRSGIGGPAVGRHLRVHPAWIVTGVYPEPIEAWSGQIQSAVSFDLTHCEDGVGFLVESLTLSPPTWASQSPFTDPRAHRDELLKLAHMASWHGVSHDHGSGRVTLDAAGNTVVQWQLDDEVDARVAARAHVELAKMHRAAGATEVFTFHWTEHRWREGEDFEAFLDELRVAPAVDHTAYSAHQMGSCRMGADPEASVADGDGQLHDVKGVWVGDASALPTAPGVNPMITIMALAERTATRIVAADEEAG